MNRAETQMTVSSAFPFHQAPSVTQDTATGHASPLVSSLTPHADAATASTRPTQEKQPKSDNDEARFTGGGTAAMLLGSAQPISAHAPDVSDFVEQGRASWYGPQFHGRLTASGKRYDMNGFTAAHRTLPLASWIKVLNPRNGRAVLVQVTDRGPYHGNRILDLSLAAARALGLARNGTGRVVIQGLSPQQARAEQSQLMASDK